MLQSTLNLVYFIIYIFLAFMFYKTYSNFVYLEVLARRILDFIVRLGGVGEENSGRKLLLETRNNTTSSEKEFIIIQFDI